MEKIIFEDLDFQVYKYKQCRWSVTFCYNGSGSTDSTPDPATGPAIFISELQDINKKFFAYYILKVRLHHFFSKIKSHKEENSLRFFLLFLLDYRRIRSWIRIRTSYYQIRDKQVVRIFHSGRVDGSRPLAEWGSTWCQACIKEAFRPQQSSHCHRYLLIVSEIK